MALRPTEQIKEKLDIVDFLRNYLSLQSAGKNFKGLCPFHKEKTPSFMVSRDRQSWHCFGCGLGGDIFAFLMRYENLEFGEALRMLAEKAGIEIERLGQADYKYLDLLYGLNDLAKDFFERELENFEPAKSYLKERGLEGETIQEFELGWAPQSAETLNLHLLNLGYRPETIVSAGLVLKTERGKNIDRFRGRLMFPIHNHFGKVVGFTGRILPQFDTEELGKYVNSPETPIFNKSRLLYGFSKTKNFIREAKAVFLVEGQMDMLMSWQAGIKNVVATSGTALTSDHLRTLKRFTDQIILSFDNDEAGFSAGERAIDLADTNDFQVKVAMFGDFKDPAEASLASPDYLKKSVVEAKPAMEFYFKRFLPGGPIVRLDRRELKNLRTVLSKIKLISSAVEQSFWLKELSKRAGLEEKVLAEEAEKIDVGSLEIKDSSSSEERLPDLKFSRRDLISQHLLSAALARSDFNLVAHELEYFPPEYQTLYKLLQAGSKSVEDLKFDHLLNIVMLRSSEGTGEELAELKAELVKEYTKDRRRELTHLVKIAEAEGDEARLASVLKELKQLDYLTS
ncbi:MAG: DNA primase [Candidatus Liptonbacteria bacterium]|nr:DNA primase [Candidatus Liptonbacteria bacterium]